MPIITAPNVSLLNADVSSVSSRPTTEALKTCAMTCEYTDWALDANCKERGLTSIPVECSQVETMDLRRNHISALPAGACAGFNDLVYLDIELNMMSAIQPGAFKDNTNLRNIYAQFNQIAVVECSTFAGAPYLRQLYLNNNNIWKLKNGAFDGIPLLEALFLSNNNISDISYDSFHKLSRLRYLYIDNNTISSIHEGTFMGLTYLRHLSLAHNRLVHIPPGTFDDLKDLRALKLSFNFITSISSLPPLVKLNHFDLYHNNLTTITNLTKVLGLADISKRDTRGDDHYREVYLAKNPFICSCELEPLQKWLQVYHDKIYGHHRANVTCLSQNQTFHLWRQNSPLCPLKSTPPQISVLLTKPRPTIQDSDLTDQALMPITIAVVSVSSVVLAILVMYSLCLKCCENKGKT